MNPYTLPDRSLEALLHDDAPCGDATTFALGIGDCAGRMVFRARYEMVVCGSEEARRMGELRGLQATGAVVASGSRLAAGTEILTLAGPAGALHAVSKTAQTLMEYLSGIATAGADIVAAARSVNPAIAVACTRKNFPGTKAASIKAVLCSGASPHRLNQSEALLVFAAHRAFLGDEREASLWQQAGTDILVTSAPYFAAPRDVAVTLAPATAP